MWTKNNEKEHLRIYVGRVGRDEQQLRMKLSTNIVIERNAKLKLINKLFLQDKGKENLRIHLIRGERTRKG